ncbi:MAG: CPBP family intramembrane glutamic endopeptidase [Pseudomonadota bacterium]
MLHQVAEFMARRVWYAWLLRVAICSAGTLLIGPLTAAALFLFFPTDDPDALRQMLGWFTAAIVISAIVAMVLTYYFVRLCFRYLDRRDPGELRMDINARMPLMLLSGCIVSANLLAVIFLFQWSLGWIEVKSVSDPVNPVFFWAAFTSLVQFASIGFSEEVRYRAYGYASGEGSVPLPVLVIANAVIYALLHAQYNQFGMIALLNLMVIAGFYIAALHFFNSIWFGVGFHFAWDFVQVSVLGLAFSGTGNSSLFVIEQTGPPILVGGTALIEAGLVYFVVFAAATSLIVYLLRQRSAGLTPI